MPATPAFAAALPLAAAPAASNRLARARARRSATPAWRRARMAAGVPPGMAPADVPGADPHDVLLGELAFTDPDQLPALIEARVAGGALDDAFYAFVEGKIAGSADLEERETLRTLVAAVKQLVEEVKSGVGMIGGGTGGEMVEEVVDTDAVVIAGYDAIINRFVGACAEVDAERALAANVEVEYDSIDKRFLDRLNERAEGAADGADAAAFAAVKDAISEAMGKRVGEAAEKLKGVLTAGAPPEMNKALEMLAAQGKLDDAIVLLLQANIEQAKAAGMEPAVQVMSGVLSHASVLKEAKLSPEVRLIRRLLRAEDAEAREDLLMTALKPSKGVMLADGTVTTGVRVNGKKFVEELRSLIEQYSNVEEAFAMRLSQLGEESENVARKIFDMEEKDVKDLQEEAFHKRSVSVWDLEQVEMREEVEGRQAAWEGRLGNLPAGFDEHGKMAI